jgi:TRAP-type C4-dicarboxylate transport system permease small subunit
LFVDRLWHSTVGARLWTDCGIALLVLVVCGLFVWLGWGKEEFNANYLWGYE